MYFCDTIEINVWNKTINISPFLTVARQLHGVGSEAQKNILSFNSLFLISIVRTTSQTGLKNIVWCPGVGCAVKKFTIACAIFGQIK